MKQIPALREHCKKSTEKNRAKGCRRFLTFLGRFRNSLAMWASNDGSGIEMTDQQKEVEQKFLSAKLKELEQVRRQPLNIGSATNSEYRLWSTVSKTH